MLKNYLKVAFRNIFRYKGYSLINISGLAIGMTACLLILYFVNYEKSYDRFHENSDRIYRLRYERSDQKGGAVRFASCCPPAGLRIRQKFPEVEKVARLFRYKASVSHLENKFIEERMYFAESDFLEIFKYKFIEGDPINGIKEPNTAFISVSTAKKYFGDQNPVGQILSVDKKTSYRITGVFKDIPGNSHLKFDILLSYQNLLQKFGKEVEDSWGDSGWYTYLLLKPHANIKVLKKKLAALVEAEFGEALKYYKLTCVLPLQPLNDIHLTSNYMLEFEVNGDRDTVNFLSILAVFIIIIAWVNYINLSTARALTRAKEVGLRKVSGASRSQLMLQFFFETVIINFFAVLFALFLVILFLPLFRQITGTPVELGIWVQSWFWLTIFTMFLVGVFLSGLYPVIVLSSFQPVSVLKGKIGNATRGISLRKALIVFQFMMALGMLISTFTVFRQLKFMKNQDLGFSLDNKLIIRAPRVRYASFGSRLQTFKEVLLKNPAISNFSMATDVPGKQVWWDAGGITRKGADDNKNYQIIGIDYEYIKLFDLKLASGRNFSKEFPSDSSALILNETASQWLGFPSSEAAIGQQIDYWGNIYTVVGVLKDYHQQSAKQAFEPHIFRFMPTGRDVRGLFVLKINTLNMPSAIAGIKKQFDEFFPGNPFEYYFLDEYYNEQYKADELLRTVFAVFAFLAIFVTSLGILGLSSFMVTQRTREIGIRKVMGSNVTSIVVFLIKDFMLLLLISFIIAFPISYYGVNYWLQSFAQSMDLSAGLFLLPLLLVVLITGLTICLHVIKAAKANPVDCLREE
jgi:putative ABC transport system permease protein